MDDKKRLWEGDVEGLAKAHVNALERIKELEAQVASLQQQLKAARAANESYRSHARKQWQDQRDYLDYEDDRR